MGEPRPCTPPASSNRHRRTREALESLFDSSLSGPLSIHGERNIRRRIDFDPRVPSTQFSQMFEFHVYLPNGNSVEVRVSGEMCLSLTVPEFVRLVRSELKRCSDGGVKQKKREIVWGDHVYIEDFQGERVQDREFMSCHESKTGRVLLLYDGHSDTEHAHTGFWNVTPEPQMLGVLPQDYTLFSALADEVDNSLQAVFQLETGKQRRICVNLDHMVGKISIYDTGKGMDATPENCISKWGTIGSSMNRHAVVEAIGGQPPYLMPNFGMYGFGGIGAGLHLGGNITVSSKTEASQRVAILHLGRESLTATVKAGSVWKTGGAFRSPTEQELQWSPHGSFTKVEISDLSWRVATWKVEEVQRKLKDYYFPYIQNDEGDGGVTDRPVEIRVNGDDLAGVMGGEVAHSNFYSSRGEPFVITLEFTKSKDTNVSVQTEDGFDKANARITCHYFPINKGREAIDDILEKLREEDSDFAEDFESFSRRSIRRLGRLLPDAGRVLPDDRSAGRLPFMEPKKFFRPNEVNRHCYKRAKAFIDVDAGFVPTTSKMDLVPKHPFTKALLELGLGLQTEDTAKKTLRKPAGPVTVTITRSGASVRPQDLHAQYTAWITEQTEKFDTAGVVCNDSNTVIIVTKAHNKTELYITKDAFQVVYDITSRGIRWKVGKDESPMRLKLQKGLPGLRNDDMPLYVTVECFISDGLPDDPGATKIVCRPMEVPEGRGSKIEGDNDHFILGESRAFPIEILFDNKVEKIDEFSWLKRLDVIRSRLPAFVELLNDQEVSKLSEQAGHKVAGLKDDSRLQIIRNHTNSKAGAALPTELIAVVRPNSYTSGSASEGPRLEQKYIFQESMEMTLVVRKMKYHPRELSVQASALETAEKVCEMKTGACKKWGLNGLYCFRMTSTSLERFTTTGTYIFSFTVVSAKHEEVKRSRFRVDITPSTKIGHWKICSHSGICSDIHPERNPEVMKVRLGEVLPGTLHLSRVDEFSNSMEFTRIPTDIGCGIFTVGGDQVEISIAIANDLIRLSDDHLSLEIPRIKVDGGELALFKPNMQAALKIRIDRTLVADFLIAVLPGRIALARVKESKALIKCLQPGQVIEHIVFEGLDNYRNPVSAGEKIKVLLEGLELQDKIGFQRSVDENGCLDLGMRLRVTAGYGETARLELRSTEDSTLWESAFDIINRKLRIKNDIPKNVAAGSQLEGIVIEAVDEDGQVDSTMDGTAHALALGWNSNITVPLQQGRCTLPPIQFPCTPKVLWKGCVAHARNPELQTLITVRLEEPQRDDSESMASGDPFNFPESSETPAPRPRRPESRVIVPTKQITREDPDHSEHNKADETALQRKEMEKKVESLSRKTKKLENKLASLNQEKKDFQNAMKRYNGEFEKISESATTREIKQEQHVEESLSTFECTAKQMVMEISKLGNPPGTHAATILLQAKREQYNGFKDVEADIIGIVALLATVNDQELNRALVEYLGTANMLAIICGSESAAEFLGIQAVTKTSGLYGYAKSRNLQISGRFRVIALTDESSFFKGSDGKPAVNSADQQKLLNIGPISKPGSERLVGSLGYAVNLITLTEKQLGIRVLGQYGLRESLFFVLFGYLEVFDTTSNMLRARSGIRSTAVSLDGGIIRARNQFEMGSREDPVVWFPAAKQPNAGPKQKNFKLMGAKSMKPRLVQLSMNAEVAKRKETVMRLKERASKIYSDGGTEEEIQKTKDKLMKVHEKTKQLEKDLQTLVRGTERLGFCS